MRVWLAVGAGAVLLAVALIVEAPATFLDARLGSISADRLHIANASGTLWQGSGELVLRSGGMRQPIAWRLEPWPLLRGEMRGSLTSEVDPRWGGRFSVGHDQLELNGLELAVPMEALLRVAGAPSLLASAGGELGIHVDRLVRDADLLDVQLALQWRNASLPGLGPTTRLALGEVRAELSGRGREVSGPLSNSGGEVEISGTITATAGSASRFEASLRPRAGIDRERSTAVAAALSVVGSRDAQGSYRVAWPGIAR